MNIREELRSAFNYLSGRRVAYINTFAGPVGRKVLADLARFCRANQTCFDPDPRIHGVMEGRREVWLRIQSHLNLSDEELWKLTNPSRSLGE